MPQPAPFTRKGFLLVLIFLLATFVILFHSILHTQTHTSQPLLPLPPLISSSPSSSIFSNSSKLPVILYWTPVSGFMGRGWLKSPERCPVKCTFTEDNSNLKEANALVFLLPGFSSSSGFPHKYPNQYFVGLSMESALYYRHMNDKSFMSHFDLTMTYKLTANITTLYISSKANYSNTPDPKTDEALASIFISNSGPLNRRNDAVSALMDLMPCHSFGRFRHNKELVNNDKKKTLRRYKFHFAFENSDTEDYITEKVFHALDAGTVPVYMGAPNIDKFMPSNHSIIKVSDFDYDYKKLADYLKYLDKHDDEYQKYFEWKKRPYTGNFKKLLDYIKVDGRCKLCMFLNGLPLPKLALD